MPTLTPKSFIKTVFIDEIESIITNHPYITFIVMGIGIEFLGKCINKNLSEWNKRGGSRKHFESAINNIPSLQKYQRYLTAYDLYGSFRCGLVHAASPKYLITLSSKNELIHLAEDNGRLNLKVEDFFDDFKKACEYVINDSYPAGNKMEIPFLSVPGDSFNPGTFIQNGFTSSL